MLKLENGVLTIETKTQLATMVNGRFTSLVNKATGEKVLSAAGDAVGSLMQWMNGDIRRLDTGSAEARLLGENRAEFIFHSWYGDGITQVWCDPASGDICVKPGAASGRVGVKAVGWELAGIDRSLKALVPTCQGIKLSLDDPLLAGSSYSWPSEWEIGLCIFENDAGSGFWVHSRDTQYI